MAANARWGAAAQVLWAKVGDPPHSLLAHFLDTAAVALAVLEREPRRTRVFYAEDWGLTEEEALSFVAFLVGLHDLGKASPDFQAQWPAGAKRVWEAGLTWDKARVDNAFGRLAHGVYTTVFVQRLLKGRLPEEVLFNVGEALGAHHGFQVRRMEIRNAEEARLGLEGEGWWEARAWLVEQVEQALGVRNLAVKGCRPEDLLRLMALASFSDWIASDSRFFPYGRDPLAPGYWERARQLAQRALEGVGWRPPGPLTPKPFEDLFPFPPNPLQAAVPRLLEGLEGPVLLLVEAPMGVGKTEAALYAYLLLQNRLDHRGLYVALPTQATANGLFPRVRAFLERLNADVPLDLQLQHGSAVLHPEYRRLLEDVQLDEVYDDKRGAEGGVTASAWFSARKRAMLSHHGVGTVDQALLGVLKVKHHFVRLWGLMNRVVILDEVHAYDTYTSGLIAALLRWLRALGSSVVLMTATLPAQKRAELLQAWGETAPTLPPYPRVAVFTGKGKEAPRAEHLPSEKAQRVWLHAAPTEVHQLAAVLRERLPGVIGVIVNTVDRAQALYQALGSGVRLTLAGLLDLFGERAGEGPWEDLKRIQEKKGAFVVGKRLPDGTLVFLLHARFPAEERALREGVVLALFGKHGPRPSQAILVATQVAEQSLDLDFDLLYSDLAPVDLLFQRAGRLHRHPRARPARHQEPVLLVGGLDGPPEFGKPLYWDRVYEEYVLLSTWLSLRARRALKIPDDLEPLLEEVYERRPEEFPELWRDQASKSYRALQNRQVAEQINADNLALSSPEKLFEMTSTAALLEQFQLDDDAEDARTQRFLTRLGEPSVPVVLVFCRDGKRFLDPEGRHPVKWEGVLSKEEVLAVWARSVRLSRFPIPKELQREEPPESWRHSGLLRGLRPLEVGRRFQSKEGAFMVGLDPELGVVYAGIP